MHTLPHRVRHARLPDGFLRHGHLDSLQQGRSVLLWAFAARGYGQERAPPGQPADTHDQERRARRAHLGRGTRQAGLHDAGGLGLWRRQGPRAVRVWAEHALEHGLILVDTKYEFGRDAETGKILLIDEIHTPDSSCYWIAATTRTACSAAAFPEHRQRVCAAWFKERCDPAADATLPEAPAHSRGARVCDIMLYELITGETFQFPEIGADPNAAIQSVLAAAGL